MTKRTDWFGHDYNHDHDYDYGFAGLANWDTYKHIAALFYLRWLDHNYETFLQKYDFAERSRSAAVVVRGAAL